MGLVASVQIHIDLAQPGRALLGGTRNKTTGGCNVPLVAVTNQLNKGGIDSTHRVLISVSAWSS